MADIPIHPLTAEIAWRAGMIAGQQAARGALIPLNVPNDLITTIALK
jgi:hypothetical protein